MPKIRIPLFDVRLNPATLREVSAALKSGWLSTGPRVDQFESCIAELEQTPYAAAVNSATIGLELALRAMGVGPGDEVITTPLTFIATLEAILHCGARPVLADLDTDSLLISPEDIARKITRKTKVIIPVDLCGVPCEYHALRKLARQHRLRILADSAHALGARYHEKSIPSWTDAAVYSFYATKNLTSGEGGMVVSRNRKLVETVRVLSRHGLDSNAYLRRKAGAWRYDIAMLGYKANLSELHGAVGLGQLTDFAKRQIQRERIVARYRTNLLELADRVVVPRVTSHSRPSWHLFIVKLLSRTTGIDRNEFIPRMARAGIECGVHYRPVYDFAYYRKLGFNSKGLPNMRAAANQLVTLPLYPHMKLTQVDDVCEAIGKILQ